jgi:hypothetical protein
MAASNKPFFPFVLLALWLLFGGRMGNAWLVSVMTEKAGGDSEQK